MYHAYYRVLVILCFSLSKVSNLVFPDRLIGYFLFIIKKKKFYPRFMQPKFTTLFKCLGRTFSAIFLMCLFFVTSCIMGDM